MTNPSIFFEIELKCPECNLMQTYHNMPDIVCDYCCADIKLKGELIEVNKEKRFVVRNP